MSKNLKNYPQSILQLIVIFGAYLTFINLLEKYTKIDELNWSLVLLSKFALILILGTLLSFEKKVRVEYSKIIKGTYNPIFGFIKIEKQLKIETVTEVILVQNAQNYFEIKVMTIDNEMIIDTFPNKNPAMEELERVEKIIKNSC